MTTDVLPLLGLNGIDLRHGAHGSRESGVCAMEAVAWLAGEKHSDRPQCACPVVASFVRSVNDRLPDDQTRNRVLKPILPKLIGSRSTRAVEIKRAYLAADWAAREIVPQLLDTYTQDNLKAHAVALRGLKKIEDRETAIVARDLLYRVRTDAYAADAYAAAAAAYAADAYAAAAAADAADAAAARVPNLSLEIVAPVLVERMLAITE